MAGTLLEGRGIAGELHRSLRAEFEGLTQAGRPRPRLVALQIGAHASAGVYARAQQKAAESLGIGYELRTIGEPSGQEGAERLIEELNDDASVTGVILQLPVPKGFDAKSLTSRIAPRKDAEGMHPCNLGRILLGSYRVGPCTAMAVMELLDSAKIDLYGKEAVVVGHSEIVGKPLALMLLSRFATTTVCHIATGERDALPGHVGRAEVLIVAVGKPGVVRGEWVKPGAIVIDVGINSVDGRVVGDVEFEPAREKASFITPVPGGVGPLTTAMLMRNVLELYKAAP